MKKDRLSHRFLVEQSRFTLLNNLKPTVEVAICKILKKSNLLVHLSLHNETMIVSLGDIYILACFKVWSMENSPGICSQITSGNVGLKLNRFLYSRTNQRLS